jgi:hypothetical protein
MLKYELERRFREVSPILRTLLHSFWAAPPDERMKKILTNAVAVRQRLISDVGLPGPDFDGTVTQYDF